MTREDVTLQELKDEFSRRVYQGPTVQCWMAKKYRHNDPYAYFHFRGISGRLHRIGYQLYRGDVPEGKQLHHLCGQTRCANPWHLKAVSPAEHKQLHAKHLSPKLVAKIRSLLDLGYTQRQVATHMGVSQPLISYIDSGKQWRGVGEEGRIRVES